MIRDIIISKRVKCQRFELKVRREAEREREGEEEGEGALRESVAGAFTNTLVLSPARSFIDCWYVDINVGIITLIDERAERDGAVVVWERGFRAHESLCVCLREWVVAQLRCADGHDRIDPS